MVGLCPKVSVQLDFRKKNTFFGKVSLFTVKFLVWLIFLLVLRICIVKSMMFFKKNFDKLVQDQFLQPVKDPPYDKFGYVVKIMPCFFSSNKQKLNLVVKNPRKCVQAYQKYAGTHVLEFVITKFSFCLFEEQNMCFTFSKIFKENQTFQKVPCFTVKWLVWLILDLTELFVLSMWWFPSKHISHNSSGSVLMNCWRSTLCWSLMFCKTYKFLCNMWCVICDVWCVMFQTDFL